MHTSNPAPAGLSRPNTTALAELTIKGQAVCGTVGLSIKGQAICGAAGVSIKGQAIYGAAGVSIKGQAIYGVGFRVSFGGGLVTVPNGEFPSIPNVPKLRGPAMNPWLLAARPKTLPAALVPVWVGSVLAWKLTGGWSLWMSLWTVFSAMAIQVATNFFNDALDFKKGADTASRLGPVRVTASGLIAPRQVVVMGILTLLFGCAVAVPLILVRGWPILAIGIPSLYFAWGYTGGPVPLAYRGLGELFVLGFFGVVAVAGTVFVQTGAWFWGPSLLLGIQVGCLSTALIAINNLRDIEEDSRTGKRTLAVRFGVGWAKYEVGVLSLLPWVLCFPASGGRGLVWPVMVAAGFLFALTAVVIPVFRTPPSPRYNRFLALAGAQLILFAVVFTLGSVAGR